MTKPNQIDPYGRAHLHPGRRTATLTGNRDYKDAWIICTMDRAWRKEGRQYLRLFFLDGATALAAGFRPCNRCQGALRKQFSAQWGGINGGSPKVADIDSRLSGERGRLHDATPSTSTASRGWSSARGCVRGASTGTARRRHFPRAHG